MLLTTPSGFIPSSKRSSPLFFHSFRSLGRKVEKLAVFLGSAWAKLAEFLNEWVKRMRPHRQMVHEEKRNMNPRVHLHYHPRFAEFSLDPKTPYRIVDYSAERMKVDRELPEEYRDNFFKKLKRFEGKLLQEDSQPDPVDFLYYPIILRNYLEENFPKSAGWWNDTSRAESFSSKITPHINTLLILMEKYKNNIDFLHGCLKQIDFFLASQVFSGEIPALSEFQKTKLLDLQPLFQIVNDSLPLIADKDPQLVCNLKIRFANLPIAGDHKTPNIAERFINLYLSPTEQLSYLIKYFRAKENRMVQKLIRDVFSGLFTPEQVKRIEKLTNEKTSRLSKANQKKLQKGIFGKANPSVREKELRLNELKSERKWSYHSPDASSDKTMDLWRVSTARKFFENQLSGPEEQIQIPGWYHATKSDRIIPIIKSKKLQYRHEGAYFGLWMAPLRVTTYGPHVIVMNGDFMGDRVNIQTQSHDNIWRALYADLSFEHPRYGRPTVVYLGSESKEKKTEMRTHLKAKNLSIRVFSTAQVDFVNKAVLTLLGRPNIPDSWWGKDA